MKGATAYEYSIGRFWIKFLRPRYWCKGSQFIRIGTYKSWQEAAFDKDWAISLALAYLYGQVPSGMDPRSVLGRGGADVIDALQEALATREGSSRPD